MKRIRSGAEPTTFIAASPVVTARKAIAVPSTMSVKADPRNGRLLADGTPMLTITRIGATKSRMIGICTMTW
jgi:hypothetical protein